LSRAEVARRVGAIAQLVEIDDILESFPRSISGGQQQRASLARALVRDADLYLLDEPMGSSSRSSARSCAVGSRACWPEREIRRSSSRTTRPRRAPWLTASR